MMKILDDWPLSDTDWPQDDELQFLTSMDHWDLGYSGSTLYLGAWDLGLAYWGLPIVSNVQLCHVQTRQ